MLMTTGNNFEGYHIEQYFGVISKEIVFRSGVGSQIGAALSNFVSSLSFRDVELSGSSTLIEKAKDYLFKEFEKEVKAQGGNAALGIDVETSFGTEVARVAISGTAVFIVENESLVALDNTDNTDGILSLKVSGINITTPFIPGAVKLKTTLSQNQVSLDLLQKEQGKIGDIEADLVFTNKFHDEIVISNICFMSFRPKQNNWFCSSPYPIQLPLHILCCVESCSVIVKKYFFNDQLMLPKSLNITPSEEIPEIAEHLSPESIIDRLSQRAGSKEMLEELELLNLNHDDIIYQTLYKTLQKWFNIERIYVQSHDDIIKDIKNVLMEALQ